MISKLLRKIWNWIVYFMRCTVDWRFLYLLQCGNKMLFKIGISHDHEIRRGQVQKAFGSQKVRRLLAVPLFFAGRIEKRLHKKYSKYSHDFREKIGRGGGRTEWFSLGLYHVFAVAGDMLTRALFQYGLLTLAFYIGYLYYFGFDIGYVFSQHFQHLKAAFAGMMSE